MSYSTVSSTYEQNTCIKWNIYLSIVKAVHRPAWSECFATFKPTRATGARGVELTHSGMVKSIATLKIAFSFTATPSFQSFPSIQVRTPLITWRNRPKDKALNHFLLPTSFEKVFFSFCRVWLVWSGSVQCSLVRSGLSMFPISSVNLKNSAIACLE